MCRRGRDKDQCLPLGRMSVERVGRPTIGVIFGKGLPEGRRHRLTGFNAFDATKLSTLFVTIPKRIGNVINNVEQWFLLTILLAFLTLTFSPASLKNSRPRVPTRPG